jgi:hypothetical protein
VGEQVVAIHQHQTEEIFRRVQCPGMKWRLASFMMCSYNVLDIIVVMEFELLLVF